MAEPRRQAAAEKLLLDCLDMVKKVRRPDNPQKWLTHIQTVKPGVVVGAFNDPMPAVFGTISMGADIPRGLGTQHGMGFRLHFMVLVDMADAGLEPLRVESDIRLALVAGFENHPLVIGVPRFISGEYDVDAMKASGRGAFRIEWEGMFKWNHQAT